MTQIDTTGHVQGWVPPHGDRQGYDGPNRIIWSDLSPFTQGYVEALFASIPAVAHGVGFRERGYREAAFSDLAPETLARIIADCDRAQACRQHQAGFNSSEQHGQFFWADRQRDCQAGFPPLTVQLGDDGKVRFA